MDIYVRADEGCGAATLLQWDTIWQSAGNFGTWALAAPNAPGNAGGLQASAALETAVVIALFTDRRCPDNHPLAKFADPADRRGWWGDGVDVRADLGEGELGSLLWLLERSVATDEMARWAKSFADEALACLLTQGACARIDNSSGVLAQRNGLWLAIKLYGRDGGKIYDRRFDVVWSQIASV